MVAASEIPLQRCVLCAGADDRRRADGGLLRGAPGVQPHPGAVVAFLGLEDKYAHAATDVDILALQSGVSTRGVQKTRNVVRPFSPLLTLLPFRAFGRREKNATGIRALSVSRPCGADAARRMAVVAAL